MESVSSVETTARCNLVVAKHQDLETQNEKLDTANSELETVNEEMKGRDGGG